MSRVLIVYATTEGQTRKISWRAAYMIARHGEDACIVDAADLPEGLDVATFDAVILTASVHEGRYQDAAQRFIEANLDVLDSMPTAFISVSLYAYEADPEDEENARQYAEAFCAATGWRPQDIHHAAGAVRFTGNDFFKQWMAWERGLDVQPGEERELTDWTALAGFLDRFSRSHQLSL